MSRLFGTDGVRGVANVGLTPELAFSLGFAAALVLKQQCAGRPRVMVGKDTRISGDMLEFALIAGITAAGVDAVRLGVLPTPGVAYLTKHSDACAGVMISASHNPFEDNGIKFFGADGFKLLDAQEDEIERRMERKEAEDRPQREQIGRVYERHDEAFRYRDFLLSTLKADLKGLHVVVDAANGAAYELAKTLFAARGARVTLLSVEPNGVNINVACGSTHPEKLAQTVKELKADIGLAFDGDADRLIAVDASGEIVDGDRIMLICAQHMKKCGRLHDDTLVTTVMSNVGFVRAAQELGIRLVRTAVGDRYVMEAMREGHFSLGGEQSGHMIFLDLTTTGDGMLSALQLLDVMAQEKKTLKELAAIMQSYPQVLVNVRVKDKTAWKTNDSILRVIREIESEIGENGRLLVRESGTESLVRVMAEGPQEEQVRAQVERIVDVIRRELETA
ncbi:phosphoglucosamine mutase [Ferroacidibacillus organovorans]|uniref:Phosphoglucosamine mutase n=1 Tax=Ferroacidibacillus organovorans TaxID=1765683 RepID=A0A101XPH5_9BACL|nr:phosphoglucosamine mutase [Ferroacidibacillus organovorans]KUO95188.1 phosphoglucosamine mutase [Ferroacidibacillus organovorans]